MPEKAPQNPKQPNVATVESGPSNSIPNFVKIEKDKLALNREKLQARLNEVTETDTNHTMLTEAREILAEYTRLEEKLNGNVNWETDQLIHQKHKDNFDRQYSRYLSDVNKILNELEQGNSSKNKVETSADELDIVAIEDIIKNHSDNPRISELRELLREYKILASELSWTGDWNKVEDTANQRQCQADSQKLDLLKNDLQRLAKEIRSEVEKSTNLETTLKNPKPFILTPEMRIQTSVFGMQIPSAGAGGALAARSFREGLLLLKKTKRIPEEQNTQANVERMLKITSYVGDDGLAEAEVKELKMLAGKINQPENLFPINKGEQLKSLLDDELQKKREQLPMSMTERANRMSKILALSLAGFLSSSQPAGQQAEAFLNNNSFSTVKAESPYVSDSNIGSLAEIPTDTLEVTLPEDQVTTENSSQAPTLAEPIDILPEEMPSYDNSVPPLAEMVPETTESLVEEVVEALPEDPPQIVESAEVGTLMIEVPKDSTVSHTLKQLYQAGLFDPYLTRSFESTKEFMDTYWTFDELVNKHPEIVKDVLQISSGNTDIIKSGDTFNVLPILSVINGEQTIEEILKQHSNENPVVEVVNDSERIARNGEDIQSEINKIPEEIQAVSEMLVTPEATEAYKSSYEGGEEAWKRDFETYVRTYLPVKSGEGWLSNWSSVGEGDPAGDIYSHIVESNMTVSQFNSLRDGTARELRTYLRDHNIPIADFRALQTMLYEIGMDGHVLISDNETILGVLEGAFVFRMESLNGHKE